MSLPFTAFSFTLTVNAMLLVQRVVVKSSFVPLHRTLLY